MIKLFNFNLTINKDSNKKFYILFLIIIIVFIFTLIGYFSSRKKEPSTIEKISSTEENIIPSPLPINPDSNYDKKETDNQENTKIVSTTSTKKQLDSNYKQLFDKQLVYLDLEYPIIYVYDSEEQVIKYIDLESEIYREIFKISDFNQAKISYNKQKFIIEDNNNDFYLLNIGNDTLTKLPLYVKKYTFALDKVIVYLSNNKNFSYLGYFEENGDINKIRNIGLLNPELVFLPPNFLLIYNEFIKSPVFLLDLKKPESLILFLEENSNYSILPDNKGNFLFISSDEGSKIINNKKETIMTFPWSTAKEKCSFKEILICAVSNNFNYLNWHLLDFNTDNKILIFDPNKNSFKEIEIEGKFDIINPQLTPMGIIFGNRLDNKIYLIKN